MNISVWIWKLYIIMFGLIILLILNKVQVLSSVNCAALYKIACVKKNLILRWKH